MIADTCSRLGMTELVPSGRTKKFGAMGAAKAPGPK